MNRRHLAVFAIAAGVALTAILGVVAPTPAPLGTNGDDGDSTPDDYTRIVVTDGEELVLEAGPEQVVRGETALPAGTNLSVRLRSAGENPFLLSASTTVRDDGTFRATFDLSKAPEGAPFEATVRSDGAELATQAGRVVAPREDVRLVYDGDRVTLDPEPDQVVHGESTLPAGTNLSIRLHSEGEQPFLMSRSATVLEDGEFRASFDLSEIDAGITFQVTVRAENGTQLASAPGIVE